MRRETIKLDATNQSMGRLASQTAMYLMGKTKVSYKPNIDCGDFVEVDNVSKMKFTGKKLKNKTYYRHTGYVGSLKAIKLKNLFPDKIDKVFRKAVFNMLPKNKLRNEMIKRLKINK